MTVAHVGDDQDPAFRVTPGHFDHSLCQVLRVQLPCMARHPTGQPGVEAVQKIGDMMPESLVDGIRARCRTLEGCQPATEQTASVRERTPSFAKILRRWAST